MTAADVERDIRAINKSWLAKVRNRDVPGIASIYTPDGKFLLPNTESLNGREAIAAAWERLFTLPNLDLTFGPTYIDVAEAGDMAIEVGEYDLKFDKDGQTMNDHGKYVVVWKHGDSGWLATTDILNTNLEPSAPGQASAAILAA